MTTLWIRGMPRTDILLSAEKTVAFFCFPGKTPEGTEETWFLSARVKGGGRDITLLAGSQESVKRGFELIFTALESDRSGVLDLVQELGLGIEGRQHAAVSPG